VSRMWVTRTLSRTATATALTAVFAIGCDTVESCGSASDGGVSDLATGGLFNVSAAAAICAASVEYQGRFYVAWSAKLPVAKGHLLGDAVHPVCNDGGGCDGNGGDTAQLTQVWTMRGVDPGRVVVARHEGTNQFAVFGRPNVNPGKYFRFAGGTWHVRGEFPRGR
jgi:Family of unknown function (DUF6281)